MFEFLPPSGVKVAKIPHDNDKKMQQENTSSPADYVLGDDSGILTGEMFGGTLLQKKNSNS